MLTLYWHAPLLLLRVYLSHPSPTSGALRIDAPRWLPMLSMLSVSQGSSLQTPVCFGGARQLHLNLRQLSCPTHPALDNDSAIPEAHCLGTPE